MSEGLSLAVQVADQTKRVRGTDLSFFAKVKQERKYSRVKLLFFCSKCGRHLLLGSKKEIWLHLAAHNGSEIMNSEVKPWKPSKAFLREVDKTIGNIEKQEAERKNAKAFLTGSGIGERKEAAQTCDSLDDF